ncbi:MAG: hypothetical protein HLUCCA11_23510 [Phormidesmis priestleyi Ana]|uniref:Uncharacterized protein n=1 Tax=Phormidesmis priestleyi Ana TaxID=1666911 RepID=A0A0P7ZFU6_9CYAN|nr:MAG: hypothetical protein HLUCCA11_23510 [Phormidesmis priestleyi Ana]
MTQSIDDPIIPLNKEIADQIVENTSKIRRLEPAEPPRLISDWVVWEMNTCIDTKGEKFTTAQLHDCLKYNLGKERTPIEMFFAENACWIIEGLQGRRARVDNDLRARVVATLKGSPYTDMQFIAGIDYFGDSNWADVQMMLIVQPQKIEIPPKPSQPQKPNAEPLIPNVMLAIVAIFAAPWLLGSVFMKIIGLLVLGGTIFLFLQSNENVQRANRRYGDMISTYEQKLTRWEADHNEIIRDKEELTDHRLSRSFKLDDLRVFHTVMVRSVAALVNKHLIEKGAVVQDTVENNDAAAAISSSKSIFDDF